MKPIVPSVAGGRRATRPCRGRCWPPARPVPRTNRTSAAVASARAAPWPASTTGRLARTQQRRRPGRPGRATGASARTTLRGSGVEVVVGLVGIDVLGHGKVDRGRAFGLGELERLAEHLGYRARRSGTPSAHRVIGREHRHQVDELVGLLVLAVLPDLRRDRHQRGAVGGGVGDAELHVDRARARAWPTPPPARPVTPAVHLGHERGALLVAGQHVADRRTRPAPATKRMFSSPGIPKTSGRRPRPRGTRTISWLPCSSSSSGSGSDAGVSPWWTARLSNLPVTRGPGRCYWRQPPPPHQRAVQSSHRRRRSWWPTG